MPATCMPVLIGCAVVSDPPGSARHGRPPLDLIARAGETALSDACPFPRAGIDTVALTRLFADTSPRFRSNLGGSTNPPKSVANRLGLGSSRFIYAQGGGDTPQSLVNMLAQQVAAGDVGAALIAGGDALQTQRAAEGSLPAGTWDEDPGGSFEAPGDPRPAYSREEIRHGINTAIVGYPMLENALRAARGTSPAAHLLAMGQLLERFSDVARDNPLADRREGPRAAEIANVDATNRMISWPYPRLMNANPYVDQAGAVLMTSTEQARRWGVPRDRWIYLHGSASAHDHWHFSERQRFDRSPALAAAVKTALTMSGIRLHEIDCFDIYSCFPCAVEIACREIGVAEDDPRPLTVTGGLFFQGGPGNAYSMLAIAVMMQRLRRTPLGFGLLTANGNILTKHSVGVYSGREPVRFAVPDETGLQSGIDAMPSVVIRTDPQGDAIVETFTVLHGRSGPSGGVMVGRTLADGCRFIATLDAPRDKLETFELEEGVGRRGEVVAGERSNSFVPA